MPAGGYQITDHPGDHAAPEPDGAEHKDGATEPEASGEPEQAPARPYGDKEHHDDEDTILF